MDGKDPREILEDARAKAAALLEELEGQRLQLEVLPAGLSEEEIEGGREAMGRSIEAASRLLRSIDGSAAERGGIEVR